MCNALGFEPILGVEKVLLLEFEVLTLLGAQTNLILGNA